MSKPQRLAPFALIDRPRGSICSYSNFDRGVNPMTVINDDNAVFRKALGDIVFIATYDDEDNIESLFFVPEYPSGPLGDLRRIMGFYGILMSEGGQDGPRELKAWDPALRFVEWQTAITYLSTLDKETYSPFQKQVLAGISEIDAKVKNVRPNLTHSEMRRRVGPAPGARIYLRPLLLGHV